MTLVFIVVDLVRLICTFFNSFFNSLFLTFSLLLTCGPTGQICLKRYPTQSYSILFYLILESSSVPSFVPGSIDADHLFKVKSHSAEVYERGKLTTYFLSTLSPVSIKIVSVNIRFNMIYTTTIIILKLLLLSSSKSSLHFQIIFSYCMI